METLLSFFFKYLLAPLFVTVMLFFLNSMKNLKRKLSMKKAVIFILISALIIALPCLLGLLRNEFVWGGLFLTILCYIGLGFIFWKYTESGSFNAIGLGESTSGTILLLSVSGILGGWIYYLVFEKISNLPYAIWGALNVLWFIVPYMIMLGRKQFLLIPPPIYVPWELEFGTFDRNYWDNIDSFEFKSVKVKINRKIGDKNYASLVVKLPDGISLGNWFNWFIEDQNRRFPQNRIETGKDGYKVGWTFYTTKWFSYPLLIRILDPHKNSEQNKIKNNRPIYIRRVKLTSTKE